MAGDWIKMRADLQTHPKVVRIASALNADRLRAVGGLHAVWCLFDAHSVDGSLDGYTAEMLDGLIGCAGFARAMESVGWIVVGANSLKLPRFSDHNGKSAKRRGNEAQRKRGVRKTSASHADKKRTREEKRREENKTSTSDVPSDPPMFTEDSVPFRLAVLLRDSIRANDEKFKDPDLQKWAAEVERLIRIDQRDPKEIAKIIVWCQKDGFWKANILSPAKLRKKYSELKIKRENDRAVRAETPAVRRLVV